MTHLQTKNFSDQDLYDVNDSIARTLIPAMVYVGVMMVFGVLGNVLVCVVFITNMKRGTQNFLITSLAVFDLLSSLLAMPVEIADMRFYYTFRSEVACKLLRFINTLCCMTSIATLVVIAVDRYLKVCRPLKTQMTLREAKISIICILLAGTLFSWPAILINGIRTVKTEVPGLMGKDCSTSDSMTNTVYPLTYHAILTVCFVILTITLAVLYSLIGTAARKHRQYIKKSADIEKTNLGKRSVCSLESSSSDLRLTSDSEQGISHIGNTETCEGQHNEGQGCNTRISKNCEKLKSRHKLKEKSTIIGFTITLVFILSFLPFLCLIGARSFFPNFDYDLKGGALVAFNVFIRSYFVNSAANPIIYGVLNVRFREQTIRLFKRLCCVKFKNVTAVKQQTSSL